MDTLGFCVDKSDIDKKWDEPNGITDSLFLQGHQGPGALLVPQVLDLKVKRAVKDQQVHKDYLVVLVSQV